MRERLIELLNKKYDHFCDQCGVNKDSRYTESLADYLLANGVIVPPCKVGDTVYSNVLGEIEGFVVVSMELAYMAKGFVGEFVSNNGTYPMLFKFENIGKTVFLTKEEAERALKPKNTSVSLIDGHIDLC